MARLQSIATAFNAGMDHFYKHCIRYGTVQGYTDYIDRTNKECRVVTVIIQGMQASITKRNGEVISTEYNPL